MPNYLKMVKRQQVIGLLELGWTYRRIESETGVRRETVSRYDRLRRANAAKVFPGSEGLDPPPEAGSTVPDPAKPAKVFAGSGLPPRSAAAACHSTIVEKHEAGHPRCRKRRAGQSGAALFEPDTRVVGKNAVA